MIQMLQRNFIKLKKLMRCYQLRQIELIIVEIQRRIGSSQARPIIPTYEQFQTNYLEVSTEELEVEFAKILISQVEITTVSSHAYIDFMERPGYRQKMKDLGNPKRFCAERELKGFSYIETTPAQLKFDSRIVGSPNPCFDWMNGNCERGHTCKYSHIVPRGCGCTPLQYEDHRKPSASASNHGSESKCGNVNASSGSTPKVCSYFQKGKCNKGDRCEFLHENNTNPYGNVNASSGSTPKVCQYFQKGKCNKGDRCEFLHENNTNPYGNVNASSGSTPKVCQYFQKGKCNKGDRCEFLHENNTNPPPRATACRHWGGVIVGLARVVNFIMIPLSVKII